MQFQKNQDNTSLVESYEADIHLQLLSVVEMFDITEAQLQALPYS